MNILVDMNLPASWENFLTGAGHTAVEWSDEGHPDATDRDVFAWAAERQYVLLTADLDVHAVSAEPAAGVILLPPCDVLTPNVLGPAVLAAIHRSSAELATAAVIAVEADAAQASLPRQNHERGGEVPP